jgi:Flp pilus assembly pilin Flp
MVMRLFRDENGQDMVEYALLVSLIAIATVAVAQTVGPLVDAFYEEMVINRFVNHFCQ